MIEGNDKDSKNVRFLKTKNIISEGEAVRVRVSTCVQVRIGGEVRAYR